MLANAIYVSGAPLSMVDHPLWQQFFKRLRPVRWSNRKHLSTGLLDTQFESTKRIVDDEIKNSNVLHLQCDGWSNIRNESIINFIVSQPKPYFVDFVVTEEKSHTGEYLGGQIEKTIEKYGSGKFYSGIGDNAANMQAGLKIGTSKYPHIETFGCVSHSLHLLCKDLLRLSSAKKVFANAKLIIKKIKKSHRLFSIFTKKQKEKNVKTALKIPPEIRWGYSQQTLESLIENKSVLKLLAVDTELDSSSDTNEEKIDDDDEDSVDFEDSGDFEHSDDFMDDDEDEYIDDDTTEEVEVPAEIKKLVLDDRFWRKVETLHEILKPIVISLTQLETDELIVHNSHTILKTMFAKVESSTILSQSLFDARDKKAAIKCIQDRKEKIVKPIMQAAAVLDPTTMGAHLTHDEKMDGMEYIYNSAKAIGIDQNTIMTQLTNYTCKLDLWKKDFVWASCANVKPTVWWKTFFGHTELGNMAEKILTTPLTSAATERSFSTFGNIHTKKRNRLTTERAGKITFIAQCT